MVKRNTTWLQRSNNVTEREQNACTTFCYVSATLWYVTIHCGTLCCMAAARHNEAHRGTTWRQRRYSLAAVRLNPTLTFTAGLQRGDSVASTWRQRNTTWHPAEMYIFSSEPGGQKRGTTARPKRDTMTGTLGVYLRKIHLRTTNVCIQEKLLFSRKLFADTHDSFVVDIC